MYSEMTIASEKSMDFLGLYKSLSRIWTKAFYYMEVDMLASVTVFNVKTGQNDIR